MRRSVGVKFNSPINAASMIVTFSWWIKRHGKYWHLSIFMSIDYDHSFPRLSDTLWHLLLHLSQSVTLIKDARKFIRNSQKCVNKWARVHWIFQSMLRLTLGLVFVTAGRLGHRSHTDCLFVDSSKLFVTFWWHWQWPCLLSPSLVIFSWHITGPLYGVWCVVCVKLDARPMCAGLVNLRRKVRGLKLLFLHNVVNPSYIPFTCFSSRVHLYVTV